MAAKTAIIRAGMNWCHSIFPAYHTPENLERLEQGARPISTRRHRLKLVLIIAAVSALPIAARAGNNKAASGYQAKTALGKTKGPSTLDKPKVDTPIDSYSQTR
jgi:hypothetical protein